MKLFRYMVLSILVASTCGAQELFPNLYTPAFRGDVGAEFTEWDLFFEPFDAPNYGDVNPASNPSITQNLTSTAFITSGFNIYSFAEATGFELENSVATPINNLVFQFETLGTFIDYDSIEINYAGGSIQLAPVNLISETRAIVGGFGGFTNRVAAQWDLTGLGIQDYTITFQALGSSNSFNLATLDTSTDSYAEVVPSARAWDGGAGTADWNAPANWVGETLPAKGGNITLGSVNKVELTTDQEVGLLTLNAENSFLLEAEAGEELTVNTGITANPTGARNYEISAPVRLGGHNFISVSAGSTLHLSGVVSGVGVVHSYPAAGFSKEGSGTLWLSGNNTFLGGVAVEAGRLILSGANAYTGTTSILGGTLVIGSNAPSGSSGALGTSTTNITLGLSGGLITDEAAGLEINGAHTVGRNIAVADGAQIKLIGSSATGALISGNVVLATTSDNLRFATSNSPDTLTFSGQISGGDTARSVTITGAGTVVYSGVNKNYSNETVISAGILELASGTASTGNGAWTVQSGATLRVNGSLAGSGVLNLNAGRLTGVGTLSKLITIDSGDVLAPGNSPGNLSFEGDQIWGANGTYEWEINDADAGQALGWDLVSITGELDITSTAAMKFTIDVASLMLANVSGSVHDFDQTFSYSWKLASATGGINGFDPAKVMIDTSSFLNTFSGSFSVMQSGNNLFLQYTAVPEPSSLSLLVAAFGALTLFRRQPWGRSPQTADRHLL